MNVKTTVVAVLTAAAAVVPAASASAQSPADRFDLQAHRGGIALYSESTLEAFANALELGVTTLELDTQVTQDGAVVVTHDRQISAGKCADTGPAFEGDPEFPYVGKYITDLTLAQVQTVECGIAPVYEGQQLAPGPMVEVGEVFDLVRYYRANNVMLNIETKVEAGAPHETAPRDLFVSRVVEEIKEAKIGRQVSIQSFDWGSLRVVEELAPELDRVALTNGDFLQVGLPGASPWLGGLDADDFDGDLVAMAEELGVEAISPVHGNPQGGSVADEGYEPYVTAGMVTDAHDAGIEVIPWTVNDRPTIEHLMDLGVDGIITDRPDLLRELMAERGLKLPRPLSAPHGSILG
ncbi:glycerophosphodiester phosphodiesterase family protein [Georgenia subflava]|uniref:Glycerophosphodiester phosphodiesterase n=1 Tax=Georgenia subflava TaxID=1622177 RepID=A0A6N7EHW4_9MICO|nr:glycerophosphodiester phosphodiesterase family protein [Georgenia subflava]MPV36307.1 glycerophosphodiester phosphodiesterase [Georgenia subflava]